MKKSRKKTAACVTGGALLALWLVWGNTVLKVDNYTVWDHRIPEAFSGFRIAQVSDLHNDTLGQDNSRLLTALEQAGPDIIVITGDLVDSRRTDLETACAFVRAAAELAPVYYVSGNHESRQDYPRIREALLEAGAVVLDDEKIKLERGGQALTLIGLSDPDFSSAEQLETNLRQLMAGEEGYTILLSHRPELMEQYTDMGAGLVFSGHAHGGQVRLPFIGGVIAPNQGFFPKYDNGLYQSGSTVMLVSRGLGDSIIPLRVNNPRSLVVVELKDPGETGAS